MREQRIILSIFKMSWMLADADLTKLELPDKILASLKLLTDGVLWHDLDLNLSNFIDNFLNSET